MSSDSHCALWTEKYLSKEENKQKTPEEIFNILGHPGDMDWKYPRSHCPSHIFLLDHLHFCDSQWPRLVLRPELPSTLIGETASCSRWGLPRDPQVDNVPRAKEFYLNGMSYPTSSLKPQGSMWKRRWSDFKRQRWWLTPRKHCLPDTPGVLYVWTLEMYKTCTG